MRLGASASGGHACALDERARLKPRNRCLAHIVGPSDISLRMAFHESLDGLLALIVQFAHR
jgi:hypothetical protein